MTIAAVTDHRCFIEGIDSTTSAAVLNSIGILEEIPLKDDDLDSCSMFVAGTNVTDGWTGTWFAITVGWAKSR